MSVVCYLSPVYNGVTILTANGELAVNGTISTYLAGTNVAANTYTSNVGVTLQQNPIPIGVNGQAANPIWLPVGQATRFVSYDSANNMLDFLDNITGINDPSFSSGLVSAAYAQANTANAQANLAYTQANTAYAQANAAYSAANSALYANITSGMLTVYLGGCSANIGAQCIYTCISTPNGNLISIVVANSATQGVFGTSNANTCYLYGFPTWMAANASVDTYQAPSTQGFQDNGAGCAAYSLIQISGGNMEIQFYKSTNTANVASAQAWTTSGTKGVYAGTSFHYQTLP